jgi:hypothetical protein
MRRTITWAELLLILIFLPVGVIGAQNLYKFIDSKISIEVRFK